MPLGVIRVDGLEQPHLSVLVDGEGWEDAPAGLVIISKMHMTALRSEEPLTGMELTEWAFRNQIPCAKLPLLRSETIAARLDEEVGKGKISVEALKLCPSCKKLENHERLPGESKKTRMPRAVGLILAQWSAEQDFDGVPHGVNPIRSWTASDFIPTRGGGGTGVRGPGIGARAGRVLPDDGGEEEASDATPPPRQKPRSRRTRTCRL